MAAATTPEGAAPAPRLQARPALRRRQAPLLPRRRRRNRRRLTEDVAGLTRAEKNVENGTGSAARLKSVETEEENGKRVVRRRGAATEDDRGSGRERATRRRRPRRRRQQRGGRRSGRRPCRADRGTATAPTQAGHTKERLAAESRPPSPDASATTASPRPRPHPLSPSVPYLLTSQLEVLLSPGWLPSRPPTRSPFPRRPRPPPRTTSATPTVDGGGGHGGRSPLPPQLLLSVYTSAIPFFMYIIVNNICKYIEYQRMKKVHQKGT